MDWHIVERHGMWWAYRGEHPPDEAFKTHGRPTNSPIVGPFSSRVAAEAMLPRRLDRFGRAMASVSKSEGFSRLTRGSC